MVQTIRQLREKSLQEQKQYTLHMDIGEQVVWISHEFMTDAQREEVSKSGRRIPDSLRILEVEFPLKNQLVHYRADIHFYPQGYSDKAVIHFKNADSKKFAILVEPFLPRVNLIEADKL
ncbi:MAG: hypothetical protein R6U27_05360 [Desulfobacterales bacterium]